MKGPILDALNFKRRHHESSVIYQDPDGASTTVTVKENK